MANIYSPWFKGTQSPAYPEVYQVAFDTEDSTFIVYRYFDGKNWFSGSPISPRYAYWYMYKSKYRMHANPPNKWRGLKEKPKGA